MTLFPNYYYPSIFKIDYLRFYRQGYRGIIFDIDNTLAGDQQLVVHPKIEKKIVDLQTLGFKICLVSNNRSRRVYHFGEALGLTAYPNAKKPLIGTLLKGISQMGVSSEQVLMVGDQLFTDTLGGNLAGLTTVLVHPIANREIWLTRIKRGPERLALKYYFRHRKQKNHK